MMSKSNNSHRPVAPSAPSGSLIGQRLTRKINGIEDPERIKLLVEILDESSSPILNDISSQQLGPRQVAESHSRLLDLLEELRHLEDPINPVLPSRSEESWKNFFEWIDEHSASKTSNSVGVSKCQFEFDECGEYSLVTKVPLKKGDKIFSIDRKLLLTTETASKDLDLHDFIRKDSIASGMPNVVLVLHLLNEYSKGEKSHWWPYLSILPKKILPILRLNKQSLAQYLLASSHIYEALKLFRSITRQYSYFYQRLHSTRLPLRRDFTFEYYAWGVSCICSRQNEIPLFATSRESKFNTPYPSAHGLIPVLDMCNHNPLSNQAIFLDNSSCLIAEKDLQPGDEITINYGSQSRSSGEFYIHNGFVPDVPTASDGHQKAATYYDVVPLTIGLSKNNKLYEKKAKLLKILNMPTVGRFKLVLNNYENRHRRDPHLTMFLIVYSVNEQDLDFILNSANPVGIADEIYEYVHYKTSNENEPTIDAEKAGSNRIDDQSVKIEMKKRLAKSVENYLSLRSSIGAALIDKTLEEASKSNGKIDKYAVKLLQCERRIFESYKKNN